GRSVLPAASFGQRRQDPGAGGGPAVRYASALVRPAHVRAAAVRLSLAGGFLAAALPCVPGRLNRPAGGRDRALFRFVGLVRDGYRIGPQRASAWCRPLAGPRGRPPGPNPRRTQIPVGLNKDKSAFIFF